MYFKLGTEYVMAKNDGGLQIMKITRRKKQPWVHGHKQLLPVLSIAVPSQWLGGSNNQAKQKKHSIRHHCNTIEKHSTQIFCEMWGQVCHKALYNSNTEY